MFRYDEFILESQLDLISESILYFSPKLRKLFKKLSDKDGATGEIATALVDLEFDNLKDDITFIDFDKDTSYVSFTTAKNARKNLQVKYPEDDFTNFYKMFDDDPKIKNSRLHMPYRLCLDRSFYRQRKIEWAVESGKEFFS